MDQNIEAPPNREHAAEEISSPDVNIIKNVSRRLWINYDNYPINTICT